MAAARLRIFVSSVQSEFERVRAALKAFLLGDDVLRRFVEEVFLFEDVPAADRRPEAVYLDQVERCDVYLGILGYEYGNEDEEGVSPTEREYDHATKLKRTRLVFVWGANEKRRHPKMKRLIAKASRELVRKRVVEHQSAFTSEVYSSIVDHLDRIGALRIPPFDTSACAKATLASLSRQRMAWFLQTARRERKLPLPAKTQPRALLRHLNLLDGGKPTNAAVLLFAENPQRFHRPAEIKCVHCHGTEFGRPFASQQNYGGDLFEQADQATDFVLSKINRAVGVRDQGPQAPVTYELPPDAVFEAIINALVHRDYHSNASVEVRLLADRLEVWNPGRLPATLTFDDLQGIHPSVPNNPLLAEPLYLTRYIEKIGSGTLKIIALCQATGLPAPDFEQRSGSLVITLWRDWLNPSLLDALRLNERQARIIDHLRRRREVTNSEYQANTGASRTTAKRDLEDLVAKGLLIPLGRGRGARYRLPKNGPGSG